MQNPKQARIIQRERAIEYDDEAIVKGQMPAALATTHKDLERI